MDPELKANILVVDDRAEQLLALETVLADLHQNTVKAQSGKEALKLLLNFEFALIILDVNMPEMDGFETAALIRQRQSSEHTPIIFKTAHGQTETHVSRGYSLGAVDYIHVPIIPEVLRAKVSVFVELYKKTELIKRQAEELRQMEKREHQRQLDQTLQQLEVEAKRNLFFVLSLDLLGVASYDGYFKQLNPSWEKTLGFTAQELKAKPLLEFVHAEDRVATNEQLIKVKAGATITYFENRFYCKDNGQKWLAWTAAPYEGDQLIYLSARDITERKLIEDKVRALKDELGQRVLELTEINQELESFTYSIAHDLRAPLRAMQGISKALLDDFASKLNATGQDYTRRIVSAAENMDALIQDLLSYSRLARADLQNEPVDLESVIADSQDYLSAELEEKKGKVTVQKPIPRVMAHRSTLLQVVTNLLSNSLKFVPSGNTPQIRVWADTNDGLVRLYIEDNGIGIAPEHHSRIFRVFERLHTKEAYPGTGIGLAIVRKGVERMSGKVGIKSELGEGSLFWIEMPGVK